MDEYRTDMRIAGYSEVTITDRCELLDRFARFLGDTPLLAATGDDIRGFQRQFVRLSPASANIYARHVKAYYDWAFKRHLIAVNPAEEMLIPKVPRGRPHPATAEQLQTIFACATGPLRMAYTLAAFAGLRRGEICRLQRQDLELSGVLATAIISGKGGKERTIPLLRPVVDELERFGLPRSGYVVKRKGVFYDPELLSVDSCYFLREIGVETTLHSCRHSFATNAARLTRDPLFVRDLLGHSSVATTEIYMQSSMNDSHLRLAEVSTLADGLLAERRRPGPTPERLRRLGP